MDPSATLSLTVTLAVLAAAVTHATWNAIAHGIKDQTLAFALIGVGGIVIAIPLVVLAALPLARRRDVLFKQPGRILLSGVAAGALSVLAYGLVLWAQTRGALAPIAALRETSVIFGAVIGTLVFREPFGRTRIAATVLVVAGIVLLNAG